MEPELEQTLKQLFEAQTAQIEKAAIIREKDYVEKAHQVERVTDGLSRDNKELFNRTDKIFDYIDELKPLAARVDKVLQKLEDMTSQWADHEARLRGIEIQTSNGDDHNQKTVDQETRIRKLEKNLYMGLGILAAITFGIQLYDTLK